MRDLDDKNIKRFNTYETIVHNLKFYQDVLCITFKIKVVIKLGTQTKNCQMCLRHKYGVRTLHKP